MARRRRKSSISPSESEISKSSSSELKSLLENQKVHYAKRKKPESVKSISFQVLLVLSVLALTGYTYYCFEHFHFHLTHFFASKWEDHHAQHILGHKLLKDRKNVSGAFEWFRKSANQGHPHSAYNLAAGHLSGYRTDVQKGEVRKLLKFAAKNGVEEAKDLLRNLCKEKPKYCDL